MLENPEKDEINQRYLFGLSRLTRKQNLMKPCSYILQCSSYGISSQTKKKCRTWERNLEMCSQLLELLGRHPGDASDHLLFLGCLNGSWSGSNIQCGPDFVPLVNTLDTQEYNSNIHLRNIKKVAEYSLCMLHNFTTCLLLCAIA